MSALIEGVFRRLLARTAPAPLPQDDEDAEPENRRRDARTSAAGSAVLEWIDQQDRERTQTVHLVDCSANGLAVRAATPLDAGWPVLLTQAHSAPLKAVVRHLRRDANGWLLGLRAIRSERRRFDRRPLGSEVILAWQGPDGRREEAVGSVQEGGEGGLRFICDRDIPFRASVVLTIDGWQRFATVVHSQPEGNRRAYGVQYSGPPVLLASADFDD